MTFPKKYPASRAPATVIALVDLLVPQLLEGTHPALAALREQFRHAQVREVTMTGVGFYADFDVPADTPLAEPADFAGGSTEISLEGVSHGAGCVLFVQKGRLATLEGYTYDGDWREDASVLGIERVVPVAPE